MITNRRDPCGSLSGVARRTRGRRLRLVATIGVTLFTGCAGTKYRLAETADTNGIRYYAPATYILVKPDYEHAKANVTFLTLPDTTHTYAVDTWAWLAKNDTAIDFKDGMISKSVTTTNSVKIPIALVEASAAVGQKLLEVAASKAALAASAARAQRIETMTKVEPVFLFYFDGTQLFQVYPQ